MAPAKQQVRDVLDRLPDDCTIEDVLYHLYVAQKLEQRLSQLDQGPFLTEDEANQRLQRWIVE